MLKTLFKKQLMEIFRGYFYNSRKNQARSSGATAAYFLLFACLIIGVVGGMFTILSFALCSSMAKVGMSWLYFAIMGMIAVVMGTFGSVFNTYSGVYLAKDNDLLLSMPIPVSMIMLTRLLSVYVMSFIYSGMVIIPAVIVYLLTVSASINAVIGCILLVLLISVFVLTLSCLLGWVVAKISVKLKNKSFITVFISILFFGGYYFIFYKSQAIIDDLLANVVTYGKNIKGSAYPIYIFGSVGVGDFLSMLIMTVCVLALFALMWLMMSRSFIKITTSYGSKTKKKYQRTNIKQKGVDKALFFREVKRFTSSPNYMLNCGFGLIMLPLFSVIMLFKGKDMLAVISKAGGEQSNFAVVILCAVVCAMVSLIDITAPSVSLEGKSIWIAQSLPVAPWQVLRAKIALQVVFAVIPTIICEIILAFVYPFTPLELTFFIIMPLLYMVLSEQFGLFLGIKMANLNWVNEITPIKQSTCVFIVLFSCLSYALTLLLGYNIFTFLFNVNIYFVVYMTMFALLTVALNIVLYMWLKKKGSVLFATL